LHAAELAARAKQPKSAREARARAAALEKELVHVRVEVPTRAVVDALEVRVDGALIPESRRADAIDVDPGDHTVSVAAPGRVAWQNTVAVRSDVTVLVPELAVERVQDAEQPSPAPSTETAKPAAAPAPVYWVEVSSALVLFTLPELGSGYLLAARPQVGINASKAFAAYVRVAAVQGSVPEAGSGFVVSNPAVGARYSFDLGTSVKLTPTLEVSIPVGMGGGSHPNPTHLALARLGGLTDAAVFNPNYFAFAPGVELQGGVGRLIATSSLSVIQLLRTRGDAVSPDAALTLASAELLVGYAFLPQLGVYANAAYLRFLGAPSFVDADASAADYLFAGGGVFGSFGRLELALGYLRVVDRPLSDLGLQYVVSRARLAF
jgi:hypothetical protein